jgi:bifunctional non-homologous end joining protein LigD
VIPEIRPMLATLVDALPRGAEWTYEVKWDGYRTLLRKEGKQVRLLSRNLKDATAQYPLVARALEDVRADAVLLDGEIVALDERGHPSFQALHHQSAQAIAYYAFDLLHLNGRDLTRLPLDERRDALGPVLEGTMLLRSEPLPGTPAQIEEALRSLRLEGAVAKRRTSRYEPGRRSKSWLKVKFNRRQEFVVGGFKPNPANFESLLVGYYDRGKLYFAGKVRAGLTPRRRDELFRAMTPLVIARCPFVNLPNSGASHWGEGITEDDMTTLRWLTARMVVEVSFVEWTRDGLLRHSQFVAVRHDKPARDVRREE